MPAVAPNEKLGMVTLIEGPGLSEPIAAWEAYLDRLRNDDPSDEMIAALIALAERIIGQKRELEGDDG